MKRITILILLAAGCSSSGTPVSDKEHLEQVSKQTVVNLQDQVQCLSEENAALKKRPSLAEQQFVLMSAIKALDQYETHLEDDIAEFKRVAKNADDEENAGTSSHERAESRRKMAQEDIIEIRRWLDDCRQARKTMQALVLELEKHDLPQKDSP